MRQIVEELLRVEGVIGSLLVGKDGLIIASTLLEDDDAEILGAMAAAIFGEIDRATNSIGIGPLVDAVVEAQEGSVLLLESRDVILVAITQRKINLTAIKLEMRRAAKRFSEEIAM